ncbi:MAG: ABC transporter ATP-binding protein [Proteobacteria bacterium]|nr:ABC transporter ATP-binding protein [Pseudomonadota bacterium]
MSGALLEVAGLSKSFPIRHGMFARAGGAVRAVEDVSFTVGRGEILGLVGESGSGKTTVGRTVLRALAPDAGRIVFDGTDIAGLDAAGLRPFRRRMQLVFQDPFSALNPRLTIAQALAEPLLIHGLTGSHAARQDRVAELLAMVGLPAAAMQRYPHAFSGGQRQRIGIARALACEPDFIVADEPVSALDVSIQAQVVNLLADLRARLGLTLLFIAHDLAVVEYIADRIAVMYLGHVVEVAESRALCRRPLHPYTAALLSAVPVPDPTAPRRRIVLEGEMPSPANPPSGCPFRTRCRYALPACAEARPVLREVAPGRFSACIRDDIVDAGAPALSTQSGG